MGMIGNSLAQGLVSGANIQDGTVDTPDIKDSAVTAAKIASGVVTPAKMDFSAGTANGVAYLNGSKVLTTGSALVFDGTNVGIGTSSPSQKLVIADGNILLTSSSSTDQYVEISTSATNSYSYVKGAGKNASATTRGWRAGYSPVTDTLNIVAATGIDSTTGLRIDYSGNLGLGVTPSAWNSIFKAIDIGTTASFCGSSGGANVFNNAYYNGTNYVYKTTAGAARYLQSVNEHLWFNAPSGTAGAAVSFTQAMTLDASGNLGVGTTSPAAKLHVSGEIRSTSDISNSSNVVFYSYAGGSAGTVRAGIQLVGTDPSIRLSTGNTERARIDSSGNMGIGTSSPTNFGSTYRVLEIAAPSGSGDAFVLVRHGDGTTLGQFRTSSSGVVEVGARSNHPLSFTTNNVERARIDSSGSLLVSRTSQIISSANIQIDAFGNGGIVMRDATANGWFQRFYDQAGSQVGSISRSGSSTVYSTSSDYRLKENIAPMTGALATVAQLKPCTYNWKSDGSASQGFIAHELQAVVPEAVVGEKDAVNEDGSINAQGIDTSFLVATLTAAIQEQQAIIESLTQRITALETP